MQDTKNENEIMQKDCQHLLNKVESLKDQLSQS